ncbi:MAG TPA: peptide-methionine (S)-S-oxide reductase MsrA [Candidatus Manganitrophaceae bacterium]|nr:peptide-methionine (S)-S-oxide reductase MsrA [Candidatus Manganitrophaceae bacterium]
MKRFEFWVVGLWIVASMIAPPPARASENVTPEARVEVATFAGGCFWCMVPPFDSLKGVLSVTSGYTGGRVEDPTYQDVSAGGTGHAEAVQIRYDPAQIGYEKLLEVFWHNIDPLAINRQFCDSGNQYRSEIFYHNEKQKRLAEQSKAVLEKAGLFHEPIATKITAATAFYPAEEYHQAFYKKSPIRYKFYRYLCGRDQRLKALWGDQAGH